MLCTPIQIVSYLGLLKRVARSRPDLKIIISSATLEVEKFSQFFNDAPVFSIAGKTYNVDLIYAPSVDYMKDVTATIQKLHYQKTSGKFEETVQVKAVPIILLHFRRHFSLSVRTRRDRNNSR